MTLATDIICGLPGESDEDHQVSHSKGQPGRIWLLAVLALRTGFATC